MNERGNRETPAPVNGEQQSSDRLKRAAFMAIKDVDRSILHPPENPAPLEATLLESTPERVAMYLRVDDRAARENMHPLSRLDLLHLTALLSDRFQLDTELDESMRRINAIYDQISDTVGNVTIDDIKETLRTVSQDKQSAPVPPTANNLPNDI